MKIVLVHPAYMDYRVDIFEKLNRHYNITFIFTKQSRGQGNVKEEQEKIPPEWNSKVLTSNFVIGQKDIGMYISLTKELLFGKYDLIITSTSWYICWIVTKLRGKKFIFMTEFWYWKNSSLKRKLLNKFTKLIAKESDAIFSMGTKAYQSYIEMGVEENKIFMHPQCSVDYSKNPMLDLKKKHRLQDKKIILFLGRIVSIKGITYLLEAFSRLEKTDKNTFLIIAGNGSKKGEYEKFARKLGIKNIIFAGAVPKKEIASYYSACDIFVLPSIFDGYLYEAWGLVINEAMSFGKPVITTNAVGASEDLIQNGYNGYTVQEKNTIELYEAMTKILFNEESMKLMGENSRKIFEEKNNYEKMYKALNNAINNA